MAIGIVGNDTDNKLINYKNENKYYDCNVDIDINTVNESHALICKNVKKESLVLDVGCSQGLIGKILKKDLNCKVHGIELDKKAIEIAKETQCYEAVYKVNIVDNDSKEYMEFFNKKLKFDYIIFADVLEHLIYPDEVLLEFSKLLNKDGKILISLPNIAHYDILNGLLNENFNYSDMGLLDNTHLRFFTKYSFAQFIHSINEKYNTNFDLKYLDQTVIKPEFYGKYPHLDKIIEKNNDYFILQNIFEIKISDNFINLNKLLKEEHLNMSQEINNEFDNMLKQINEYKNEIKDITEEYNEVKNKCKELEKKNLQLNRDNDSLNYLYNLTINSKSWKITKPLRTLRDIIKEIKLKTIPNDYKTSVLFFVHSWVNVNDVNSTFIGGTTLNVIDIINNIKNDVHCYVVSVIENRYVLIVFDKDCQKIYDLGINVNVYNFEKYDFNFYSKIKELIYFLQIDMIHIHHIINFPCDLNLIAKDIKTLITLHDYTSICPKYFMIDNEDKICLKQSSEKCMRCMNNQINELELQTRNTAIKNLLMNSNMVIVPDESVLKNVEKIYKINNSVVIPHGLSLNTFEKFEYSNHKIDKKHINIAFVGNIDGHKGGELVYNLISNNPHDNIYYHLYGMTNNEKFKSDFDKYTYHGPYKKSVLPKKLNEDKIDLVLFLNNCLESFSYALSEVIYSQIPCVSFDIGAIGNRIKKNNIGWVIKYTQNPKDINKIYNVIFNEKEYKEKIKNLKNYKNITIEDMVESIRKYYNTDKILKNNYLIEKYLEKYQIKYIL